jgi:hypothetical protein
MIMSDDSTTENDSDSMDTITDNESGSKQSNVDSVFANMIARAYAVHRDEKEQKIADLVGEGVDKAVAGQRVHEELLQYRTVP